MGASTSQRTSNGASVQNNTVKPIDHDSASMQDLVRPRGQQGQPPYQIASTDSGPLHNSSAPRGQQGPQRPSAARSQASGSSLGFGSRGPRGKIMPRSEIEGAEVVKSSIPLGLPTPEIKLGARTGPGVFHTEIPTVISWTPSKSVAPDLEKQTTTTRADPNRLPEVWVQDTYNGRTRLTYNPEQDVWIETVRLPLGNMSLRFLVDGELQMSTDLPLASDTDGALVNYVTVMPSPPADGEAAPEVDPNAAVDGPQAYHPPMWSASRWLKEPGTPDDPSGSSPPWTSEIPLQLIQAQAEEEAWAMHESLPAEQRRSLPIPPVPILPQAPMLPRHLDKVILSSRAKKGSGTLPHSSARKSKKKDGRRDRERGLGPSPLSQDAALADASLGLSAAASGAILVDAPHGDDDAVLPVPSHVVLHHLGTSAIRDGVIAVCDTVRYRKKVCAVYRQYRHSPMLTRPRSTSRQSTTSRCTRTATRLAASHQSRALCPYNHRPCRTCSSRRPGTS